MGQESGTARHRPTGSDRNRPAATRSQTTRTGRRVTSDDLPARALPAGALPDGSRPQARRRPSRTTSTSGGSASSRNASMTSAATGRAYDRPASRSTASRSTASRSTASREPSTARSSARPSARAPYTRGGYHRPGANGRRPGRRPAQRHGWRRWINEMHHLMLLTAATGTLLLCGASWLWLLGSVPPSNRVSVMAGGDIGYWGSLARALLGPLSGASLPAVMTLLLTAVVVLAPVVNPLTRTHPRDATAVHGASLAFAALMVTIVGIPVLASLGA